MVESLVCCWMTADDNILEIKSLINSVVSKCPTGVCMQA